MRGGASGWVGRRSTHGGGLRVFRARIVTDRVPQRRRPSESAPTQVPNAGAGAPAQASERRRPGAPTQAQTEAWVAGALSSPVLASGPADRALGERSILLTSLGAAIATQVKPSRNFPLAH